MLALAVFVATGSLVLGVMTDCTRAVARAEQLASAVDCARSLMAEFEAGLRPMGDLAGGELEEVPPPWEGFRVEARTRRSDFDGLVLAEIGVFEREAASPDAPPLFSLRQLLPARGVDIDVSLFVLPSLEQSDRLRMQFDSTLTVDLFADLDFKLTVYDRYDSQPPEGNDTNDSGLTLGLSWSY